MPDSVVIASPLQQFEVEQFYYREARLLDNRQYQSWLALCTEDIQYSMPARGNPLVNNREHGNEDMISVERELETAESNGCPIREEGYLHLALRVDRSFKINAWAENPPARTRRIVGNVEILQITDDRFSVNSNFQLFYARPGSDNFLYAGQRRDVLVAAADDFRISSRQIIMDVADIRVPTLGLFF